MALGLRRSSQVGDLREVVGSLAGRRTKYGRILKTCSRFILYGSRATARNAHLLEGFRYGYSKKSLLSTRIPKPEPLWP